MKILKLLSSGLILHEDFSTPQIRYPLIDNAEYTKEGSSIIMTGGSIDIDASSYSNLVFEIVNGFIPSNAYDVGGIRISNGLEKRELFEYSDGTPTTAIPYVRLVKTGDVYTGYGSEGGTVWNSKGYVVFPHCEKIGVAVSGNVEYKLFSIKLYKNDYITIYSVLPGWSVFVSYEGEVVASSVAKSDNMQVKLPYYPFSGTFRVYNENNILVSEVSLSNVWGGDTFACVSNIDLLTWDGRPLTLAETTHLGNLQNGVIEEQFIARNNNDFPLEVTIRVASYNEFYDWVHLATEEYDSPQEYGKEITVNIPANSDVNFWLKISRPEVYNTNIDYRTSECSFFLEVI